MMTLHEALYELMDYGFESGERYVYAADLAFLLGRPFAFQEDDGEVIFRPEESWLASYDGPNPTWQAIRDQFGRRNPQ